MSDMWYAMRDQGEPGTPYEEVRAYECSVCHKYCLRVEGLVNHMRCVHEEKGIKENFVALQMHRDVFNDNKIAAT